MKKWVVALMGLVVLFAAWRLLAIKRSPDVLGNLGQSTVAALHAWVSDIQIVMTAKQLSGDEVSQDTIQSLIDKGQGVWGKKISIERGSKILFSPKMSSWAVRDYSEESPDSDSALVVTIEQPEGKLDVLLMYSTGHYRVYRVDSQALKLKIPWIERAIAPDFYRH
jgi:hypothetical protein